MPTIVPTVEFSDERLANGLRLIVAEDHLAPVVAALRDLHLAREDPRRELVGGEVVRVGTPWAGIRDGFLGIIGIGVEGVAIRIDELYGVFEL